MSRPPHLQPGLVALVGLGGAVGTLGRFGLSRALPTGAGWPLATFAANLVGAFLLGLLLEALVRRGPEDEPRRRLRLALGTGVLGGFTTFSAMAIEIERLGADGSVLLGGVYGLVSIVAGVACAGAGVALAARRHGSRRQPRADGAGATHDDGGAHR